ncbi:MAG: iron ABC transporter permease [Betaproteobacteria bacterium]|nr:MAG: iron ABC transporter permease [Betaproteobacteria bacterium]
MSRISAVPALLALTAIALVAIALALSAGSVAIDPASVLRALFASGDSTQQAIVRELRLPRAVAAFAAGGCLSLAGALLQVLLRNSLADPYVLGVSGGAAAGALTTMLLGAAAWLVPVGAFGGAMASTAIVFGLARGRGPWSPTRLLLTGVVVAAGWGAVVALILSLAPEAQLRGMLFWLIGDLSAPPAAWSTLGALVLAVAAALPFAGTTAGAIGFVGLIVPHAVRLVLGNDQRVLLPAAALAGGTLLLVADILARQIAAPAQLPTGVITALIGVPTFLYLLRREQR